MSEKMMSLYDYLGKAAGSELGKNVALYAKAKKTKSETRFVSNPKYTGEVMLYTEEFLNDYFEIEPKNKPSLERKVSDTEDNTLPF